LRIIYAPKARADLQTCVEYAKDNPLAAARLADRVFVVSWARALKTLR
jgi:plasmid stabilization system protein ParE